MKREAALTPGARKAGRGEYVFDFNQLDQIMGGPGYSPVFGGCVEGERMIVARMRAPAGKMGDPHSHPNEQWIYVLEGEFEFRIDGQTHRVGHLRAGRQNPPGRGERCRGRGLFYLQRRITRTPRRQSRRRSGSANGRADSNARAARSTSASA
jgi:Cupin domain